MENKKTVGILFGGPSAEHDVSMMSVKNIIKAIDTTLFDVRLVYVDQHAQWLVATDRLSTNVEPALFTMPVYVTQSTLHSLDPKVQLKEHIDVFFPVIHGTYGEDGVVQGVLEAAQATYVGAKVLGASTCMDKDVSKRLMKETGISVLPAYTYNKIEDVDQQAVMDEFNFPFFIKPANQGSSVGVSKVSSIAEFDGAVTAAFEHDSKILIEPGAEAREIECAVIGNLHPRTSSLGEIVVRSDFYTYEAKYSDPDSSKLVIPASIETDLASKIIATAKQAYVALNCRGLARVDFFVCDGGVFYVNEVNTMPGFTNTSMFPKLWEEAGLTQRELITELIELALN